MFVKKMSIVLLLFLTVCLYAQDNNISLERATFLYDAYLRDGLEEQVEVIHSLHSLESTFLQTFEGQRRDEQYLLYMRYARILSAYYADGNESVFSELEHAEIVAEQIAEKSPFSPKVLLSYADYRASTLFWTDDSFDVLKELPTMYRRIARSVRNNEELYNEVITKLALYGTNLADAESYNRNTFIENNIKGIENLSDTDTFMAYLALAYFYMNSYDVKNGWKYLALAQSVYPKNPRVLQMAKEYSKEAVSITPVDIRTSEFNLDVEFYGLPQRVQAGWIYRENDFSIYPNAGVFFDVDEEPKLGLSVGVGLQKSNFTLYSDIFYDIYPFTLTKPANEQIIAFKNDIILGFHGGSFEFPNLIARKKLIPQGFDSIENATIETVFDQGIGLNLFLFDLGFFRMNAAGLFTLKTVPQKRFYSYEVDVSVPATIPFYYFDIGLIYEFLYAGEFDFNSNPSSRYIVKKQWSKITGRTALSEKKTRYTALNALELEVRWYFLRNRKMQNTSLFFSTFSQIGFGFNEGNNAELHYEYGLGFGYVLLDVVPFTFQAGLDNNLSPVFKFSVVSKILHSS